MSNTFLARLPRAIREDIIRGILDGAVQKRDELGWDQPYDLFFISLHMLDNKTMAAVLEDFPISPRTFAGNPHQQLETVAEAIYMTHRATGAVPPLPEQCAGILFLTESWMFELSTADEPVPPPERPDRQECLSATFAALNGTHMITAIRRRDTDDSETFISDLEDMDEETLARTVDRSLLVRPLITIAALLSALNREET